MVLFITVVVAFVALIDSGLAVRDNKIRKKKKERKHEIETISHDASE